MTTIPFEILEQIIQCFGYCFHYKNTVEKFMLSCGVPDSLIKPLKQEKKFVWANKAITELSKTEEGIVIVKRIAMEFYNMRDIRPEVEDRDKGIAELKKLKKLIIKNDFIQDNNYSSNSYHRLKKDAKIKSIVDKKNKLSELEIEFTNQFHNQNSQDRGYTLEKMIGTLLKLHDIPYSSPYRTNTQQMDGHFKFDNFDYLIEAKWVKEKINSSEIASFKQKIDTKFQGTRGMFVSINGFREEVIRDYSNRDSNIIFMDGEEFYYILENRIELSVALRYKISEASKTGNTYASLRDIL